MTLTRRDFLKSITAAGATVAASRWAAGAENAPLVPGSSSETVNVAIIGAGAQGRILLESAKNIPGIQFKAVCDVWDYSQQYAGNFLMKHGHKVNVYEDYREMLDKEKDLHAVIVASPDWMHAEHANACMQAERHVYCEKEMSNTLEKARTMVETSRSTKKLLQIGHQRRSNPRYIHAFNKLIRDTNLLGRVTHANAQWNRSKSDDIGWPKKYALSTERLSKYGYSSMHEFRNWRWFKKFGGGPIVDLGSHQIDLFSWVFGSNPKSVIASGGVDFYTTHEWYDNVMCIFEYDTPKGVSRAFYQVLTTTSNGGFKETFMGENGNIVISEVPPVGNTATQEAQNKATGNPEEDLKYGRSDWELYVKQGLLGSTRTPIRPVATKNTNVDARVSAQLEGYPLPIELAKPAHQPHLENFFDAIRLGTKLNCPGEIGYETAVAVLACNEAVRTNQKIEFKPSQFTI